jgi:hypothetical protein
VTRVTCPARSALRPAGSPLCLLLCRSSDAGFDAALCRALAAHRVVAVGSPWAEADAPVPAAVEFRPAGPPPGVAYDLVLGVMGEGAWDAALAFSWRFHCPLVGIARQSLGPRTPPTRVSFAVAFGKAARVAWGLPPEASLPAGDWAGFAARLEAYAETRPAFELRA